MIEYRKLALIVMNYHVRCVISFVRRCHESGKLLEYIIWNIASGDIDKSNVDFIGYFLNVRVFLQKFNKILNGFHEVNLAVIVDSRVRAAFDSDIIFRAKFVSDMSRGKLFGIGVDFDSMGKLRLLLDCLNEFSYF